ncbi:MAG TPA: hypothetical protein VM578_00950 [Candidatus Saccharimonadales bacterium]|nr:hypothetical protein [Candidatus Saccharimonadales bacterium]
MKPFVCTFALFVLLAPALAQQAAPSIPDEPQQSVSAQAEPEQTGMSQAEAQAQARAADQADADAQDAGSGQQAPDAQPAPSSERQAQPPVQQPPYDSQSADQQSQPQPPYAEQYPPYPQAPPVYYPQPGSRRARREQPIVPSVRPRSEAAAYPVYRQQQQFSVGARLLSAKEVEQRFSTPLGKRYLVVEVGVFPAGETLNLRADDFTLRAGNEDQAFFPASPDDVLTDLSSRRRSGSRDVRVYPSVGVGYESGGWGRGVSTGVGVGVAGAPYPRRGASANRRVMQTELREKALPQGNLTQPVAGYLYFPSTGKRARQYTLELHRNGETTSLPLPNPKN